MTTKQVVRIYTDDEIERWKQRKQELLREIDWAKLAKAFENLNDFDFRSCPYR